MITIQFMKVLLKDSYNAISISNIILKGVGADFEKIFNSIYRTDNHVEWLSVHQFSKRIFK